MKADQMQPWSWHQRGQPLHELQRRHDQMGGAVAPRRLELQLHLPGGVALHPLVRQRRPSDVAAQLLEPLAVVCLHTHRGVQADAVDVGAQGLPRCGLARHRAPESQHLVASARTKGDAVRHRRCLQRPQRAYLVPVSIRLGQIGLPHVFHQHAPAREQLHQPGDERLQQRVQFVVGGRIHLDEARHANVAAPVHAVQHQAVQMDIQVGRRAKALDERDGAAVAFVGLQPRRGPAVAA
jgi:hypothetical protein